MPPIVRVIPDTRPVQNPLTKFYRNVFSQGGEDGILEEIFRVIGSGNKWCVEFGAWDGVFLSNTCNLIRNHGWKAVMIEGNQERCDQIRANHPNRSKVIPLCAMVGFERGVNTIDDLLKSTPIPLNFDLISIDVDGVDWHIWDSIVDYRPRIVVIEFNPTVPNDVVFIQERDMGINEGCSAAALVELAAQKGYELVCVTNGNCFFVVKEEYEKFALASNRLDDMRRTRQSYVFNCYNGKIYHTMGRMSWYGKNFKMTPDSLQFLSEFIFHGSHQGRPSSLGAQGAADRPDLETADGIIREMLAVRADKKSIAQDQYVERFKKLNAAIKEYASKHIPSTPTESVADDHPTPLPPRQTVKAKAVKPKVKAKAKASQKR